AFCERQALGLEQFLRARLQVQLGELRLPIEHVERRRRAGHVEVNDGLCLRREMRFPRRERIGGFERGRNTGVAVAREQTAERDRAEAQAGFAEELPAREGAGVFEMKVEHLHYQMTDCCFVTLGSPSGRASKPNFTTAALAAPTSRPLLLSLRGQPNKPRGNVPHI